MNPDDINAQFNEEAAISKAISDLRESVKAKKNKNKDITEEDINIICLAMMTSGKNMASITRLIAAARAVQDNVNDERRLQKNIADNIRGNKAGTVIKEDISYIEKYCKYFDTWSTNNDKIFKWQIYLDNLYKDPLSPNNKKES